MYRGIKYLLTIISSLSTDCSGTYNYGRSSVWPRRCQQPGPMIIWESLSPLWKRRVSTVWSDDDLGVTLAPLEAPCVNSLSDDDLEATLAPLAASCSTAWSVVDLPATLTILATPYVNSLVRCGSASQSVPSGPRVKIKV